uniref:Structural maintenance of chromosomes 6 n=1 Tax=Balaenoptera musculus TaxID=9771 RepID=A0A8C0DIT9_BALMU
MAKRKEGNFFSPGNAKRPRQEELDDFDKDGDEDECTVSFTNGTSTLTAADVGIIESIQLRNFMCHSMLGPFKFGSNVNFVVGNNGISGEAVKALEYRGDMVKICETN